MDEKMIEVLAGAMVYCQVDVCGLGMFRAPNFAKDVVAALKEGGYEIEIRPTQDAPNLGESAASDSESNPAPKRVI